MNSETNRVIVFGGDGFCGWPSALHLSEHGYDVVIVDNLSRRKIDIELECDSLTPISPMGERLCAWEEVSGKKIQFELLDVAEDYDRLVNLLLEFKPSSVVHFAEQRAAPYSMKSPRHKRYTIDNNINATHNILCAITESKLPIHLVHLGTMGVYGYGATPGLKIPEGYLNVKVDIDGDERQIEIPYPPSPGSVYHLTKTMDALMFFYYNKNDQLRITDLHQGIVWGTNTEETAKDPRLINRFDYDGDYGTVLNRFLMQAAIGYPLTVHGTGGQTRAFIHIRNTVECIRIAIESSSENDRRVRVLNQATETHTVNWLAEKISKMTGAEVQRIPNPRLELTENDLDVENKTFLDLGLKPITLADGLLQEVIEIASKFGERCDRSRIPCVSKWRDDIDLGDAANNAT